MAHRQLPIYMFKRGDPCQEPALHTIPQPQLADHSSPFYKPTLTADLNPLWSGEAKVALGQGQY